MRTDLSLACPACALRLPASATRCSRCGGTELPATEVAQQRIEARCAEIGQRRLQRLVLGYVLGGILAGVAVGVGFSLSAAGEPWPLAVIQGLAAGAIGLFVGLAGTFLSLTPLLFVGKARADWFLQRIARAFTPAATLRVSREREAQARPGRLRGRVVGPATGGSLETPRGTPCVALGVRGEAGRLELDDAVAVSFLVETEDGKRVRVDPSRAVLVGDASRARELDANEAERLGRSVPAATGAVRVRVAELSLAPGDEVEVDGELVTEADPDPAGAASAREPASRLVARATDERPLLIRLRAPR